MTDTADTSVYPPYGHMVLEWEKLTYEPKQPDDWQGPDYREWLDQMAEILSAVLWPRYIKKDRRWRGKAVALMDDVTQADFALFKVFRPMIGADAGLGDDSTQYQLFQLEDESDAKDSNGQILLDRSVDASLRKYLAGKVSAEQAENLASNYITGIKVKAGRIDLDLKVHMQRPRAYQVAWLLGIDFTHQHAKSAVTPSMISGHCQEMLMAGAAAFLRAVGLGCPTAGIDAIARHMVDVGDRRVYAGVHYASDNISSWITGLLTCPHVFPTSQPAEWMWAAIRDRSVVYRELRAAIDRGEGRSYLPSMELLEAIGSGRISTAAAAMAHLGLREAEPVPA